MGVEQLYMGLGRAFVPFPRQWIAHPVWKDHAARNVLFQLLGRARYHTGGAPGVGAPGGRRYVRLEVGQAVCGVGELASELGYGVQQTRTALDRLERWGIITRQRTDQGSIVTLVGYEEFWAPEQCDQQGSQQGTRIGSNRPPTEQPPPNRDSETEKQGNRETRDVAAVAAQPSLPLVPSSPRKGPKAEAPTDVTAFRNWWRERFAAVTGHQPTWQGKQAKQAQGLIAQVGLPEVQRRAEILLSGRGPAWLETRDLGTLAQHFDKFVTPAAATPVRGVKAHGATPEVAKMAAEATTWEDP